MPELRDLLHQAAPVPERAADVEAVRRRAEVLRRHRRILHVAGGCVAALLIGGLTAQLVLDGSDDGEVHSVDRPPAEVQPEPAPITPAPTTADTLDPEEGATADRDSSSGQAAPRGAATDGGAPRGSGRSAPWSVQILTDPEGDVEASGPPVQSLDPDSSLDLLGLDMSSDGTTLTFVQQLAGPPDRPPEGADGRIHRITFRVRGHNPTQVFVQTLRKDLDVSVSVLMPGNRPGGGGHPGQCDVCRIEFDGDGHRVVFRIPIEYMNDVMVPRDAGRIERGAELTWWSTDTGSNRTTRDYVEERESPHYYSAGTADTAQRGDFVWKIP